MLRIIWGMGLCVGCAAGLQLNVPFVESTRQASHASSHSGTATNSVEANPAPVSPAPSPVSPSTQSAQNAPTPVVTFQPRIISHGNGAESYDARAERQVEPACVPRESRDSAGNIVTYSPGLNGAPICPETRDPSAFEAHIRENTRGHRRIREQSFDASEDVNWTFTAKPGRCYSIVFRFAPGVQLRGRWYERYDLRLVDSREESSQGSEDHGELGFVSRDNCSPRRGRVFIRHEAFGEGRVNIAVYERSARSGELAARQRAINEDRRSLAEAGERVHRENCRTCRHPDANERRRCLQARGMVPSECGW